MTKIYPVFEISKVQLYIACRPSFSPMNDTHRYTKILSVPIRCGNNMWNSKWMQPNGFLLQKPLSHSAADDTFIAQILTWETHRKKTTEFHSSATETLVEWKKERKKDKKAPSHSSWFSCFRRFFFCCLSFRNFSAPHSCAERNWISNLRWTVCEPDIQSD